MNLLNSREIERARLLARLNRERPAHQFKNRHLKIVIGSVLLLVIYFLFAWWVMMTPRRGSLQLPAWTPAEKHYVTERMKFHGITSCIRDAEGYYFIRAGKRCRL